MTHVGGGYELLILYSALFNIRYRVAFSKLVMHEWQVLRSLE